MVHKKKSMEAPSSEGHLSTVSLTDFLSLFHGYWELNSTSFNVPPLAFVRLLLLLDGFQPRDEPRDDGWDYRK